MDKILNNDKIQLMLATFILAFCFFPHSKIDNSTAPPRQSIFDIISSAVLVDLLLIVKKRGQLWRVFFFLLVTRQMEVLSSASQHARPPDSAKNGERNFPNGN